MRLVRFFSSDFAQKPVPHLILSVRSDGEKRERQPKISLTLCSVQFSFSFLSFLNSCVHVYSGAAFHTSSSSYCTSLSPYSRYKYVWFRTYLCWNTTETLCTKCHTLNFQCMSIALTGTDDDDDCRVFVSFQRRTAVILAIMWTSTSPSDGRQTASSWRLMATTSTCKSK